MRLLVVFVAPLELAEIFVLAGIVGLAQIAVFAGLAMVFEFYELAAASETVGVGLKPSLVL